VTHAHFGLLRFHSKSPKLHKWPPYGNFLTLRKLNCRAVICADVHFRVQWQVGQLESTYMSLPMNRDLKYCKKSVATKKYQSLVHTCGGKIEGK